MELKCPLCQKTALTLNAADVKFVVGAIGRCECCDNLVRFGVEGSGNVQIIFGTLVSKKPNITCVHTITGWFK